MFVAGHMNIAGEVCAASFIVHSHSDLLPIERSCRRRFDARSPLDSWPRDRRNRDRSLCIFPSHRVAYTEARTAPGGHRRLACRRPGRLGSKSVPRIASRRRLASHRCLERTCCSARRRCDSRKLRRSGHRGHRSHCYSSDKRHRYRGVRTVGRNAPDCERRCFLRRRSH